MFLVKNYASEFAGLEISPSVVANSSNQLFNIAEFNDVLSFLKSESEDESCSDFVPTASVADSNVNIGKEESKTMQNEEDEEEVEVV